MTIANISDAFYFADLTLKMNRDNRFRFCCNFTFKQLLVHTKIVRMNVDENRLSARLRDRLGAGYPAVCSGDDFVTWPDPEHFHDDEQRICAIRTRNHVTGSR